ncbi:MAG: hypothetical protein BWY42_01509 [Candidatus Omnitrophica bacterium ADurb.Bin277]|nr:MAG: hypothetical protein BWY42_01509 [Candidatus Omnitrophica bacterium ADurb.Bin277]
MEKIQYDAFPLRLKLRHFFSGCLFNLKLFFGHGPGNGRKLFFPGPDQVSPLAYKSVNRALDSGHFVGMLFTMLHEEVPAAFLDGLITLGLETRNLTVDFRDTRVHAFLDPETRHIILPGQFIKRVESGLGNFFGGILHLGFQILPCLDERNPGQRHVFGILARRHGSGPGQATVFMGAQKVPLLVKSLPHFTELVKRAEPVKPLCINHLVFRVINGHSLKVTIQFERPVLFEE